MATPAPAAPAVEPAAPPPEAVPAVPPPVAPEAAAVPLPVPAPAATDRWPALEWLPCSLEVKLSVPHFTVGDVLRMAPQTVVETRWQQNADVPVRANGQLLAWAEFEGVDEKLAVRITRLA